MHLVLIAVLLTGAVAQDSVEEFLDKIYSGEEKEARFVSSTAPSTPSTERSCGLGEQCVRRSRCSPRNTDGTGIIEPRITFVEATKCLSAEDICCPVGDIISEPVCGLGEQCVRRSQCSPKNRDGTGIIEPRFTFEEEKNCSSAGSICCSVDDIITQPTVAPKRKPGCGSGKQCIRRSRCTSRNTLDSMIVDLRFSPEEENECPSVGEVCCPVEDIITQPTVAPKRKPGCGSGKQCVRLSRCSPKSTADSMIVDIRFSPEEENECPSVGEVCCSVEDIITQPTIAPKKKPGCGSGKQCVRRSRCSTTNTDGRGILEVRFTSEETEECSSAGEVCCLVDDIITEPIVMQKDKTGCGYRNVDGIGPRIGTTTTSEFGEFPWMLAVLRISKTFDEDRLSFVCGASLIHPAVALTAAWCVYNKSPDSIKVRAGEWELNSETELHPHQDRQVVDIVHHKNYNNDNLHYNIALLFVDIPFELTPNVNTACLPPVGFNFNSARCYATGWGTTRSRHGEFSKVLKKVDLPIVPRSTCQEMLRRTRLGRYFELHWSFLCAGGERGKDTCRGDAGSPLVCPIENTDDRFYQAGIVGWGIGCFDENVPRVLSNVADLRPWIDSRLAERNVNSSYYTV